MPRRIDPRLITGPAALAALFACAACLTGIAPPEARAFVIEAEDWATHGDMPGGQTMASTACEGALNGFAIKNFDRVGEFIGWNIDAPDGLCFVDSLRMAWTTDVELTLEISFHERTHWVPMAVDTVPSGPGLGYG